eukprot:scaffold250610_cov30-Tisochrysis_lutea.AAC.23
MPCGAWRSFASHKRRRRPEPSRDVLLCAVGCLDSGRDERVRRLPPRIAPTREDERLQRWQCASIKGCSLENRMHNGAGVAEGAHATHRLAERGRGEHATLLRAEETCGFIDRSWAFGGTCPKVSPIANRNRPAAPAAGSAWPELALIEPIASGESLSLCDRTTAERERTSMGSPRLVPVPCASMHITSFAEVAASLRAPSSRPCCATPFGAVSEADLPSCRTQLPSSGSW